MVEITKEFDKYIEMMSQNFIADTDDIDVLKLIEIKRRDEIRNIIISLAKLYYNIPLELDETTLLKKYSDSYNECNNIRKNINILLFNISQFYIDKVRVLYSAQYRKDCNNNSLTENNYISNKYISYLRCLDQYNEDFSYAVLYNYDVVLYNKKDNSEIRPRIDFKNQCFINSKCSKKTLKKRIVHEKIHN